MIDERYHVTDDFQYVKFHIKKIYLCLQSIPLKNRVDVASNGERFTLTNAANLNLKN
jgi:hypothetical protein